MATSFTSSAIFLFLALVGPHSTLAFSLKILHVNDHHSHLAEETFSIATADLDPSITAGINTTAVDEVKVTYGGFPRLVTLFQQVEASSTADATLKVHAGDACGFSLIMQSSQM
jgi:5'-nucleotidase / UDP-sugar diphosphatase